MQLLITGAASPRGQATLVNALAKGHRVYAVLSPTETEPSNLAPHPQLTWCSIDWLEASGQEGMAAVKGMDAVIHLDEVTSGPFERHYLGTVQTTERLIQAMVRSQVRRLVLMSSLNLYAYGQLATDQLLDETSPLESALETRSPYVQAKLMQEALLCSFSHCWGGLVTILRPGVNYNRQQVWQPRLGLTDSHTSADLGLETATVCPGEAKRYWQISPQGRLPLLHTACFASAAIAALDPIAIGETFNLVDDHLPSRMDYSQAIAAIMPIPRAIPVPWVVAQGAERIQQRTGISLPRLPSSLDQQEFNANFKPLRYSNVKAKRILHWQPETSWRSVLTQTESHKQEQSEGLLMMEA